MHYYKFNIADYRKDTAHLSLLEHGIYRQLRDSYYLDEKPILTQQVMRRLSIKTQEEKMAFNNVIADFFTLSECGLFYSHKRIDEEITTYKNNSEVSRVNGSKGGRPKKPKETQQVNLGSENKPKQKPTKELNNSLTNNQLKEKTCAFFDRFWLAGMKKLNKSSARKSFDRVLKSESDKNTFVDNLVLDIQKRLSLDQLGFDKMHPTTYLNNRRWEDEYAENNRAGGGNNGTRRKTPAEAAQHLRDMLGETDDFGDGWGEPRTINGEVVGAHG